MNTRGCFVTGSDTGAGKTVVACAIVRALCARGIDVGVLKPIETGVGEAGPLDAIALRNAAGSDEPIAAICPQQFALPAAPTVAAQHAQRKIDLDAMVADAPEQWYTFKPMWPATEFETQEIAARAEKTRSEVADA